MIYNALAYKIKHRFAYQQLILLIILPKPNCLL